VTGLLQGAAARKASSCCSNGVKGCHSSSTSSSCCSRGYFRQMGMLSWIAAAAAAAWTALSQDQRGVLWRRDAACGAALLLLCCCKHAVPSEPSQHLGLFSCRAVLAHVAWWCQLQEAKGSRMACRSVRMSLGMWPDTCCLNMPSRLQEMQPATS